MRSKHFDITNTLVFCIILIMNLAGWTGRTGRPGLLTGTGRPAQLAEPVAAGKPDSRLQVLTRKGLKGERCKTFTFHLSEGG